MARTREQERERHRRRRGDWPNKSRCEARTVKRRRQCPFMGYFDPAEGGYRCGHHGEK